MTGVEVSISDFMEEKNEYEKSKSWNYWLWKY